MLTLDLVLNPSKITEIEILSYSSNSYSCRKTGKERKSNYTLNKRPSTKLLSIGRQITDRFC